jgi:hypothetical protein
LDVGVNACSDHETVRGGSCGSAAGDPVAEDGNLGVRQGETNVGRRVGRTDGVVRAASLLGLGRVTVPLSVNVNTSKSRGGWGNGGNEAQRSGEDLNLLSSSVPRIGCSLCSWKRESHDIVRSGCIICECWLEKLGITGGWCCTVSTRESQTNCSG